MAVSGVHSAAELSELCLNLLAVEEWLREHCPARHATDMADVVDKAYTVIDDLYDTQRELENYPDVSGGGVPWPPTSARSSSST